MKKTLLFAHLHAQADLGKSRLLGATYRPEALLELVDTTLGIHELVLTGEEGVRVGGDTARNHIVLNTIDNLSLGGGSGGTSDEAAARGDVHEHYRIVLRMQISFHSLIGCVTVAARERLYSQTSLCQVISEKNCFMTTKSRIRHARLAFNGGMMLRNRSEPSTRPPGQQNSQEPSASV